MGRVNPYVQGQLQSELVGVPQVDDSAGILSNVLNQTTAMLADAGVAFGRQLAGQRNAFMYNAANNLTQDIRARQSEQRSIERQELMEARSVQRAAERELQKNYEDELFSNGHRDIEMKLADRANSIPQSTNLDDPTKVLGDFKTQGLSEIESYITDSGITNPRVISRLRQAGNTIITSKYGQVSKNLFAAQDANVEEMNNSGLKLIVERNQTGKTTLPEAMVEIDKIEDGLKLTMTPNKAKVVTNNYRKIIANDTLEKIVKTKPENMAALANIIRENKYNDNPIRDYVSDNQLLVYEKQARDVIDARVKEADMDRIKGEERELATYESSFNKTPLGNKEAYAGLEAKLRTRLDQEESKPEDQRSPKVVNGISNLLRQTQTQIEKINNAAESDAKQLSNEQKALQKENVKLENEKRFANYDSQEANDARNEIMSLVKQLPSPTPSNKVNPYAAVRRASQIKEKVRAAEEKGYYDNPYAKRGSNFANNIKQQADAVLNAHSASAEPKWETDAWFGMGKTQGASDQLKESYKIELGTTQAHEMDELVNEAMSATLDLPAYKGKKLDESTLRKMRKVVELNIMSNMSDEEAMHIMLNGRLGKNKGKK